MRTIIKLGLLVAPLLALIPVVAAVPTLEAEYEQFAHQWLGRDALEAPAVAMSAEERERYRPLPVTPGAIPVLTYHGINDRRDEYSVTQAAFARQMAMLDQAGYSTISIEQFARWMNGEQLKLPERPILLTFDDGRLDSFKGADQVLAEHDFRATMFVITGQSEREIPFHLYWDELREIEDGGRWDLQLHAHDGHVRHRYNEAGRVGPFYAYRKYLPHIGRTESFWHWKKRVAKDLDTGERLMAERLDDFEPWSFALPYGNYGEDGNNDHRIPDDLAAQLTERFAVVFDTNRDDYAVRGSSPLYRVPRHELHTDTSVEDLYAWLRTARPRPPRSPSIRPGRKLGPTV
jgi:biofilm PGA synthesis lipoprotein PgaB